MLLKPRAGPFAPSGLRLNWLELKLSYAMTGASPVWLNLSGTEAKLSLMTCSRDN